MGFYPRKAAGSGLKTQTDALVAKLDAATMKKYSVTPAAADADIVLAATTLTTAAQVLTYAGLTNPTTTGVLTIYGNTSAVTGNVVIVGTDSADQALTETIALSGTTKVTGAEEFKTVTTIALPVRTAAGETVTAFAGAQQIMGFVTLLATAQTVVKTIAQPDVTRGLSITGTKAGGSLTGNVVIAGTNYADEAISNTIALNDNAAVNGTKAFKTISTITLPVRATAGDTVKVGVSDVLGLPDKLAINTVQSAYLGGAKEGTAPTVAVSSSALESNTFDLNSSLEGSAVVVYYID